MKPRFSVNLIVIYCVQSVACLLVIPPALILAGVVALSHVLHFNVRVLLVNLIIAAVITDIGTLIPAAYHMVVVFGHSSDNELCLRVALNARDCAVLNAVRNFGIFMTSTGLVFLALERIAATIQFKTYEKRGRRAIGIVLLLIQVIFFILIE
jgi:hypothetical protein